MRQRTLRKERVTEPYGKFRKTVQTRLLYSKVLKCLFLWFYGNAGLSSNLAVTTRLNGWQVHVFAPGSFASRFKNMSRCFRAARYRHIREEEVNYERYGISSTAFIRQPQLSIGSTLRKCESFVKYGLKCFCNFSILRCYILHMVQRIPLRDTTLVFSEHPDMVI